jgi:hypothetical protein
MIGQNKTYTTAKRSTVYRSKKQPDGSLFLRDLNRSQSWENIKGTQGWGEGYLITGGIAAPHSYQIRDGVTTLKPIERAAVLSIGDFIDCDVVSKKVPFTDWLGLE